MTRALIARADNGGLANMLLPLAEHVRFDKILVVFAGHTTRGLAHPERYQSLGEVRICDRGPRATEMEWLTNGVEVVYTAETWYHPFILELAQRKGVRTVVHAMPELWSMHEASSEVWAPTPWRTDVLPPHTRVVPVPVDRERIQHRAQNLSALTLVHVTSNAMCDRDGTDLVLAAAPHLNFETEIRIIGRNDKYDAVKSMYCGLAHVQFEGAFDGPFWELWNSTQATDLLVQPRRFGGLCLTMQEAAARGLPIVTLDLNPQRSHLSTFNLIPSQPTGWTPMKGGSFNVMTCDPLRLATHLNQLAQTQLAVDFLAGVSDKWAKALDWSEWVEEYERLL